MKLYNIIYNLYRLFYIYFLFTPDLSIIFYKLLNKFILSLPARRPKIMLRQQHDSEPLRSPQKTPPDLSKRRP